MCLDIIATLMILLFSPFNPIVLAISIAIALIEIIPLAAASANSYEIEEIEKIVDLCCKSNATITPECEDFNRIIGCKNPLKEYDDYFNEKRNYHIVTCAIYFVLKIFLLFASVVATVTLLKREDKVKHEWIYYSKCFLPINNKSLRRLKKLEYMEIVVYILLNICSVIPIVVGSILLNKRQKIEYDFIPQKYVVMLIIISVIIEVYNVIIYFTYHLLFELEDSCYGHTIIWIWIMFEFFSFCVMFISNGFVGNIDRSFDYCCYSSYSDCGNMKCRSKDVFKESCKDSMEIYYIICFVFLVIYFIPYVLFMYFSLNIMRLKGEISPAKFCK